MMHTLLRMFLYVHAAFMLLYATETLLQVCKVFWVQGGCVDGGVVVRKGMRLLVFSAGVWMVWGVWGLLERALMGLRVYNAGVFAVLEGVWMVLVYARGFAVYGMRLYAALRAFVSEKR